MGIAVGQAITGTANPLSVIPAKDGIPNWQNIEKLIKEWQPKLFVVGLPLNMDDSEGDMSIRAEKFARRLTGRFGIPHQTIDERLSSFEAREFAEQEHFGKNESIDAIAAKLILETYFRQNQDQS